MKKRLIEIIMMIIMAAGILSGCGSSGGSGDGTAYVQGLLDVAYNKGTEAYVKAADVKEEDARKYMEQSLEAEAKVMAAYFGMEEPSAEASEIFKDFCKKLFEAVDYKVEAKGDAVQISAGQIVLGDSEAVWQYVDDFNIRQFVDGADSKLTSDEAFAKGVTELMEKEELKSGDQVTIEVKVTQKDGKSSVSDEDLQKIDEQLIVYH